MKLLPTRTKLHTTRTRLDTTQARPHTTRTRLAATRPPQPTSLSESRWRRRRLRHPRTQRTEWILRLSLSQLYDLVYRLPQIRSLTHPNGIEKIEIRQINPAGHQRCVVESHPLEHARPDRVQLWT